MTGPNASEPMEMNNAIESVATLPFIDETRLRELVSMESAIDVLHRVASTTLPTAPDRQHLKTDNGELLLMPAWGESGMGVKLVAMRPDNPERGLPLIQGVFVMFASEDSRPIGLIDGAALTALRTAAVSGLATRYLSRGDASRLVLIGTGRQARSHLDAMLAVRQFDSVSVVNPMNPEEAEEFVLLARSRGVDAKLGSPESVRDADVVCTCTSSLQPVFEGDLLPEGCHVTAMGAYRPDMRELDARTLIRGSVFVESREAAMMEAGDLIIASSEGWSGDLIAGDIEELAQGTAGRHEPGEITVFKSVGVAWQDLVVAAAAFGVGIPEDGAA